MIQYWLSQRIYHATVHPRAEVCIVVISRMFYHDSTTFIVHLRTYQTMLWHLLPNCSQYQYTLIGFKFDLICEHVREIIKDDIYVLVKIWITLFTGITVN